MFCWKSLPTHIAAHSSPAITFYGCDYTIYYIHSIMHGCGKIFITCRHWQKVSQWGHGRWDRRGVSRPNKVLCSTVGRKDRAVWDCQVNDLLKHLYIDIKHFFLEFCFNYYPKPLLSSNCLWYQLMGLHVKVVEYCKEKHFCKVNLLM